jgi:hypothetical protein
MPSPAFRAARHDGNASTTSFAVFNPTGLAVNDIMIAFIYYEYTGAVTITPPASWAEITACAADNTSTDPDFHARLWWKRTVQADIDTGTKTFGFSQTVATNITVAAYSGALTTGTPIEAGNKTTGTGNVTLPSITTLTDATLIIGCAMSWDWTKTWSSAVLTERNDTDGNAIYDTAQATAGASGTKAITQSAADYYAGMICDLASVAAGGTTYNQSVAGTLTSAGAPTKRTATAKAGTLSRSEEHTSELQSP